MGQVGFFSALLWYPVGSPALLHSFFSTVCLRLEEGVWGLRFPVLMGDLYSGVVEKSAVPQAIQENRHVSREFARMPPEWMIWDCENPASPVPSEYRLSGSARCLLDCFMTSQGEYLSEMLGRALAQACDEGQAIRVMGIDEIIQNE